MHDFRYVSKIVAAPVKADLLKLIHEVQDYVRDEFTFQFRFVGSAARNMITYDAKSNVGFDFDVNIYVNDDDEDYKPNEIRQILKNAIDRVAPKYGYDYCEDSTRVLTIKVKDTKRSRIIHSCDFCIVYDLPNGKQQKYIRFNKTNQTYPLQHHNVIEYRFIQEVDEEFVKGISWMPIKELELAPNPDEEDGDDEPIDTSEMS